MIKSSKSDSQQLLNFPLEQYHTQAHTRTHTNARGIHTHTHAMDWSVESSSLSFIRGTKKEVDTDI